MKPITFPGNSLAAVRSFPEQVKAQAGYQLSGVQHGREPTDWKPLTTVGVGVREMRIRDAAGAFRVIYLANLPDRVLVLHAFAKKTQATPQRDLDLAAGRLWDWRR